jgi:hypothetical protein
MPSGGLIRNKLMAAVMAFSVLAVPAWGKKKKTPDFRTIEITRFVKEREVELTPNFLDYLYQEVFAWAGASGVFEYVIGENEVVPQSDAPRSLALRGVVLRYGKGSHAKSMIGFGIGRRSLEAQVTLFRRLDNATLFETQLKVRSLKTTDEKYLALFLAKELAGEIEKNTSKIRAALAEADRRYVPPPASTTVAAKEESAGQAASDQASQPAADEARKVAAGTAESPAAPSLPSTPASPKESEPPARETAEEPGTVVVNSSLDGAEVYVDESFVGNTPARVKLAPGKHTVRVVMSGEDDWTRQLSVLPGSELKVFARHTPKPAAPQPVAPAPDPKAMSKEEILSLLASFVPNARIAALVKEHGVKFAPTTADIDEIVEAGGDNNLVEAVRHAAPPARR